MKRSSPASPEHRAIRKAAGAQSTARRAEFEAKLRFADQFLNRPEPPAPPSAPAATPDGETVH
jgi:hypothetical protein